ncbi:MAG: hypothetical protein GXX83_08885 [Gaiellales bacterium]|nr:hypothetical protein [Gaiellales bacterium]
MSIARLRLLIKRNFTSYYLQLHGYGVADPTDTILSCTVYLAARTEAAGHLLSDVEFDAEIQHIAGEIEQDLLRKGPGMKQRLNEESVPVRVRECMLVARGRTWPDADERTRGGRGTGE